MFGGIWVPTAMFGCADGFGGVSLRVTRSPLKAAGFLGLHLGRGCQAALTGARIEGFGLPIGFRGAFGT